MGPVLCTLHSTKKLHCAGSTLPNPCVESKGAKQQEKDVTGGCSSNLACKAVQDIGHLMLTCDDSTLNNQAALFRDSTAWSTRRGAKKRRPNQSSSLIPQLACRNQQVFSSGKKALKLGSFRTHHQGCPWCSRYRRRK